MQVVIITDIGQHANEDRTAGGKQTAAQLQQPVTVHSPFRLQHHHGQVGGIHDGEHLGILAGHRRPAIQAGEDQHGPGQLRGVMGALLPPTHAAQHGHGHAVGPDDDGGPFLPHGAGDQGAHRGPVDTAHLDIGTRQEQRIHQVDHPDSRPLTGQFMGHALRPGQIPVLIDHPEHQRGIRLATALGLNHPHIEQITARSDRHPHVRQRRSGETPCPQQPDRASPADCQTAFSHNHHPSLCQRGLRLAPRGLVQ